MKAPIVDSSHQPLATHATTESHIQDEQNADFLSYVFAYGSLVCPQSRATTAPSMAQRQAIPVRVHHLERHFSMPTGSWTAMGVRFRQEASCVGVLLQVQSQRELKQLDQRELGYDRNLLSLEHVKVFHPANASDGVTSHLQVDPSKLIWVYIQQKHVLPSLQNPISQTYVDIILRGCLTISEEFCKEFITSTGGWQSSNENTIAAVTNDEEATREEDAPPTIHVHWVNDRNDPLYVRADQEYSLQAAQVLDQLLQSHVPLAMERRREQVL
jgi:cation transport regulator ChaC